MAREDEITPQESVKSLYLGASQSVKAPALLMAPFCGAEVPEQRCSVGAVRAQMGPCVEACRTSGDDQEIEILHFLGL